MTKQELNNSIALKTGIDKNKSLEVIENFMTIVKDQVAKGEEVTLRGFGTFHNIKRNQKNFHAAPGKIIIIPEHYEVHLKFSKEVKEAVKNAVKGYWE